MTEVYLRFAHASMALERIVSVDFDRIPAYVPPGGAGTESGRPRRKLEG